LGGEKFAAATLMRDKQDSNTGKTDTLDEDWAQSLPPVPVDQSTITGCVFDLQGRFNLNNLLTADGKIDTEYLAQLKRLLTSLNIDASKASAIADWLDADSEAQGEDGAEENYYAGLEVPYRPANRALTSVSDIKMVKGFNPAIEDEQADYDLLLPHITALPEVTAINVNTATADVIASIDETLGNKSDELTRWSGNQWELYPECEELFDLEALVSRAQEDALAEGGEPRDPFASGNDFFAEAGLADKTEIKEALDNRVTTASAFFMIRIEVVTGEVTLTQFTLVKRDASGASAVLQRSRNVF